MLDLQPPRRFHDVKSTDDIAVDIGARIFDAVANAGLRSEMDDDIGSKVVDHLVQKRVILQQPLCSAKGCVLEQGLMPPLFKADVVIIGHAIEAVNRIALRQQQTSQVEADKSRGPGNENLLLHAHLRPCCTRPLMRIRISA